MTKHEFAHTVDALSRKVEEIEILQKVEVPVQYARPPR